MNFNFVEGSIIPIDKPFKWTSFDVVNKIRTLIKYKLGIKKLKIGHAGTLDPLATGLLILCSGKFTKRIEEFQAFEKEYTGTFFLGATTPSYDLETKVENLRDISNITEAQIAEAFNFFKGGYEQMPPVYSAKKIDGERAYEFARKGKDVEMKSVQISIPELEIVSINLPEVAFRIVCSKGTYIRALARDIGEKIGCGAYLSSLRRTRIGEYNVADALKIEQFEEMIKQ
ncbi:MAG TPA: tRNA pseudouridine(55) synthase TruB [Bacteroidales bacterium]|nr:tRNA pseudouridine(55) synthase TruB [Bacteroidales bacterium]HPS17536.1 tRNA pseudouridine(55) synthase TruB [Bacteroidales bacterium]